MINKNKLIIGVDDDTWRKYTAHCKAENVKVGDHLSDVLSNYLILMKEDQSKGSLIEEKQK